MTEETARFIANSSIFLVLIVIVSLVIVKEIRDASELLKVIQDKRTIRRFLLTKKHQFTKLYRLFVNHLPIFISIIGICILLYVILR